MSIFSQTAQRIFEALNIWQARGFQVIRPNGRTVPWSVNNFGRMAVGHAVASYPVHVVTAAGSSLGVVVTDNTLFWLALGKGAANGVAAVQASGTALALVVNGTEAWRTGTAHHLTRYYIPGTYDDELGNINLYFATGSLDTLMDFGNDARGGAIRGYQDGGNAVKIHIATRTNATYLNRVTVNQHGNVGFGTETPTGPVDIATGRIRVRTAVTPASSTATANQGELLWNNSGLYVAIGTNSLKRIPFSNSW